MAIEFKPTKKQDLAFQLLTDKTTTEILYGGSVGSGKSRLACYFLLLSCLQYPGIRCLLGRSELKNLKQTSVNSLLDICKEWGIEELFNYNKVDSVINFNNGSQIVLKDLKASPQDESYTNLGSSEYSICVVDEGSEIPEKCYQVLKTRLRYKLKEYNLTPKLLICSNPSKGYLYNTFYKPYTEGTLPPHRKFIQALPNDNEYLPAEYLATLTPENLGFQYYSVLVLGNWDYASTDFDLFEHEALLNCFYHTSKKNSPTRYITIDPASSGKDSTVISVWFGYDCLKIIRLQKNDTQQIVSKVKELMTSYNVRINNIIVDRVGVGVGVFDLLKGCTGFVANARPLNNEPFQHLKAQLYFKFAQMVNAGEVGFAETEFRDEIIQQLQAHKRYNTDKDGRAEVTPKAVVKQMLGSSPDFADSLSMRAYFEYKQKELPLFY